VKNLHAIGVSHLTAPIDVRERLWFSSEEIRAALPKLKTEFFQECVLLSTCNRTEVYGFTKGETIDSARVRNFLADLKRLDSSLQHQHFYSYTGDEAARQLFKVATGIDSMLVGDVQILGQVKEAYQLANACQTLGVMSSKLFQAVLRAGKRSRTETKISEGAVSISYGAVELAGKIFDDLRTKTVLLIGAGKTSELTVKHLRSKGIKNLLIANRTRSKAEELIQAFGGRVIDLENLRNELRTPDIIISSVGGSAYILTASDLSAAMKERNNRPLFIIDIGVPRNIDPTANAIENVFLHDIDGLRLIVDMNLQKRKGEIPKVERIIEEELERFTRWCNSLQVIPTIEQLQSMAEEIRREELQKHRQRLPPADFEKLDLITKRIVNRILHTPISNLRNGQRQPEQETLRMLAEIRKLFGLAPREENTENHAKSETSLSEKHEPKVER
jgi:glutamyl-tRNA reductase